MRAYFFGNIYLSLIQNGIQAAHVITEMFIKYPAPQLLYPDEILWDWAMDHKTIILLNGGYSENLHRLIEFFTETGNPSSNPYPFAYFKEGQDALDGALTCVGIVLPEKIYVTSNMVRNDEVNKDQLYDGVVFNPNDPEIEWSFSPWEINLVQELNEYSLAH